MIYFVFVIFYLQTSLALSNFICYSMHYRVFYAAYLFENESVYTSSQLDSIFCGQSGQQSIQRYG